MKTKSKQIDGFGDIGYQLKEYLLYQKRSITKSGGVGILIRRLTAKILWFSLIFLILINLSNYFSLNFISSLGIVAAVIATPFVMNAISDLISNLSSTILFGKFFDKFTISFLNRSIVILLILIAAMIVLPKIFDFKFMNKNEKK